MYYNQTTAFTVYKQIKELIVNLEMKFGNRIDMDILSNDLGVSQTPIREALNLLIKDELINYVPRRGYFVVDLSYNDMYEIYELRELIECFSIEQSIEKDCFDTSIMNGLLQKFLTLKKCKKKKNTFFSLDKKFHLNIVESISNKKLYNVYLKIYPFINISQKLDPMIERSLNEHIDIIKLILNKDMKAVNLLKEHINNCKEQGLAAFKNYLRDNKS